MAEVLQKTEPNIHRLMTAARFLAEPDFIALTTIAKCQQLVT